MQDPLDLFQILVQPIFEPKMDYELDHLRVLGKKVLRLLQEHQLNLSCLKKLQEFLLKLTSHKFNKENKTFEQSLLQSVDGTDIAELAVLADALNSPGDSRYGLGVKEKFNKLKIELEILRKHITEPLSDIIYRIINQTGLLIEIMASDQLMAESRYEALMSLQDLAESFDQGSPHGVVREFLAWLNVSESNNL